MKTTQFKPVTHYTGIIYTDKEWIDEKVDEMVMMSYAITLLLEIERNGRITKRIKDIDPSHERLRMKLHVYIEWLLFFDKRLKTIPTRSKIGYIMGCIMLKFKIAPCKEFLESIMKIHYDS